MIRQITGLIFLGIAISVGIDCDFNIHKMAARMRIMALEAMDDTMRAPLMTIGKGHSPNPYGCGTYECHKRMTRLYGPKRTLSTTLDIYANICQIGKN